MMVISTLNELMNFSAALKKLHLNILVILGLKRTKLMEVWNKCKFNSLLIIVTIELESMSIKHIRKEYVFYNTILHSSQKLNKTLKTTSKLENSLVTLFSYELLTLNMQRYQVNEARFIIHFGRSVITSFSAKILHKIYHSMKPFNENRVRSSRPEVFCKKGVLKNFTRFTGKYLCQSLFYNKVASLRPATLLKKRLWQRLFL